MVGPPRKPGPGPWRYGGLKSVGTAQPKIAGLPAIRPRVTVITQWRTKQWYGDPIFPNIATLTAVQDLVQTPADSAWRPKSWAQDELLPNVAANTAIIATPPVTPLDYPALQAKRWADSDFPNLVALIPAVVPPAGPTDAGRHHKRYKVILGSRTVYFATKAEAVAARERHREVIILEAKAAGIDPKKISVRAPRITRVKNWRHPEPIATPVENHPEILTALHEAQMREEEEVAIALLLMR